MDISLGTIPTPILFIVGALIIILSIIPHLFVKKLKNEYINKK
jgi:hypothetical protein